ncbi:anthranilate synthase component II [Leptothoe sp. PORK10 BA2]|uniref:anthranilate synthase component II n=1 Tax=Leptothoe sp. PORK10 BA2 TaxID=3110254 RepID=UPI002B1F82EE|nr:aminodeoxychorismate/anthranilate synthase component II [Leptothoe sp. PORK10 BA2]MEA5465156.1 aminodeoxychorismate/anthranilate synthase component II [Leptothoe sp. PORK10 BA2]
MILVIDNYDSFTYNLVQYLGELGQALALAADIQVFRNDQITLEQIRALAPDGILISPGPGTPNDAGISLELIKELGPTVPILGVCLGHQSIGQVFGGTVTAASELMHGKTSPVIHTNQGVFAGLENPLTATRYHSLIVDRDSCPDCLEITAWIEDGTIMGLRHRQYPHIQGVQFHPESVLTQSGKRLLQNFLSAIPRRLSVAV